MAFTTDTALMNFEESWGDDGPIPQSVGCTCRYCAAHRVATNSQEAKRVSRTPVIVRRASTVVAVLAGACTVGLGLGAGVANADPAPAHAGWDGSKYWFKNSAGEWRWTSHYSIYRERTGDAQEEPGGTDDSGIRQGWDGSRYWFQNAEGEWRWTSHYAIYRERTGDGAKSGSSSGAGHSPVQEPTSGSRFEIAVDYALAQLGKPYIWGGNGPDGFDCSGLVQQAYLRAGIELPRVAADQYTATTPIGAGDLRRGDLIFWSNNGRPSGIHHVAIYLGNGQYVEAPHPGTDVRVSTLSSGYYPDFFGRP